MKTPRANGSLAAEFGTARLGDERLERRLGQIASRLAAAPASSFPDLMMSDAELEATYRFLSNDRVSWRGLLQPHLDATMARAGDRSVIVAHDTTEFHFRGEDGAREGLGVLANSHRGFEGHFALALGEDSARSPLGVVGLMPVVTEAHKKKVSASAASKRSSLTPQAQKKSERWNTLVREVEQRLGAGRAIHVMDREADSYVHWAQWLEDAIRFVVRAKADRHLERGGNRMSEVLEGAELKLEREVPLSARKGSSKKRDTGNKSKAPRTGRMAVLVARAARMRIERPPYSQTDVESCAVNVVHVFEPTPPEGEVAVDWRLLTSESIDTPDQIAKVIDAYRGRWVIEELFKALKTGCAYEQRQLMSLRALLNALALSIPIAWRMLAMRTRARTAPEVPASSLFKDDEIRLLRKMSVRVKLGPNPTAEEALLALAGLGGHLKRNGAPGWQTLGRGYQRFMGYYSGWLAAREM